MPSVPSRRARKLYKRFRLLKPITEAAGISACRAAQDQFGLMTAAVKAGRVAFHPLQFDDFEACRITPRGALADDKVLLYLHGGGYTAGDLAYAVGFGSVLCAQMQREIWCVAYRLAPEYPFPAALDDAHAAYVRLLDEGVSPARIVLCGESAGGGLAYALMHRLRDEGAPTPAGIVAISPWTDLTCSGDAYLYNADTDPSLSRDVLRWYARLYAETELKNPYVSPLYGSFAGFPPSLLFCGGDEVLRSDADELYERLLLAGCSAALSVAPGMWHVYVLFRTPESDAALQRINTFLEAL